MQACAEDFGTTPPMLSVWMAKVRARVRVRVRVRARVRVRVEWHHCFVNLTRYQIRGVAFSDKGNQIDLPYRTPRIDLPDP